MKHITLLTVGTMLALSAPCRAADARAETDDADRRPRRVFAAGRRCARQILLVTGSYGDQGNADLTADATYESLQPEIASVSAGGVVTPKARRRRPRSWSATPAWKPALRSQVRDVAAPAPVDFRTDVIAALSRAGCNQGSCHGSPQGKNGFRLSLRGFDPDLDFRTLTREAGGRRVNPHRAGRQPGPAQGLGPHQAPGRASPTTAATPPIEPCASGSTKAAKPGAVGNRLVRLEVLPEARRLHTASPRQQLTVRAHFEGGAIRDVTDLAVFTSNDPTVAHVVCRRPRRVSQDRRDGHPGPLSRSDRQHAADLRSPRSGRSPSRARPRRISSMNTSSPSSASCSYHRRRSLPIPCSCAASIST